MKTRQIRAGWPMIAMAVCGLSPVPPLHADEVPAPPAKSEAAAKTADAPEQPRTPPAERFRPSEEVSADQEVDFPADI